MEPTPVQLEKLKKIELDMLINFVEVCNKLKLKYYLLGGTLLGAVRHKGFIPWDDDIDIGMPRKDYDIFMCKGQELLRENLFLQNIDTDKEYYLNFAKIRNSETTFVESSYRHHRINHGVYIDIFPLDYFPDDENQRKVFRRKNSMYNLRIAAEFYLPNTKTVKFKIATLLLKIVFPTAMKISRKRERLFKSVEKSSYLANYCGAWGAREIVPKDWYGEGTELCFEGIKVTAPKEYDKWLTQVYGDYMQLPPVEKQKGHHFVEVIDLEKSYREYMG